MSTSSVPRFKRCPKCEDWLPATTEYFAERRRGKDGFYGWCKECSNADHAKRQRSKGVKPLEIVRRDGMRKCPTCSEWKPLTVEHFTRNRAAADGFCNYCRCCKQSQDKSRYRNLTPSAREIRRQKARSAFTANQERYRAYGRIKVSRRRARQRELASALTTADWMRALDYFGGCCAVCGRPPGLWHRLAVDHWWIPQSKGGGLTIDNIVPLCHGVDGCNNSKSSKDPIEWLTEKLGKRKAKQKIAEIETYFEWVKTQIE